MLIRRLRLDGILFFGHYFSCSVILMSDNIKIFIASNEINQERLIETISIKFMGRQFVFESVLADKVYHL